MATKALGTLPVWRGEYASGTTYYKLNIVRRYGCEFIYTGGASTTTAPATINSDGTAITLGTGWEYYSDASASYFASINEPLRVAAEKERATAETERQSNENTRKSNETNRQSAETSRATAETTRQSNETSRQSAETKRETDCTAAVTAANAAATKANQAAAAASGASVDGNVKAVAPLIMNGAAGWIVKLKAGTAIDTLALTNASNWDIAAKADEDTWCRQDGDFYCGCGSWPWSYSEPFTNILAVAYCPPTTKLARRFGGMSGITELDTSMIVTTGATDMSDLFYYCSSLTTLDLSGFDTSSVTKMERMFMTCTSLTTLDLSGFDTSAVTSMDSMFQNCSSLTTLDLSAFDTSAVTKMERMFMFSSSLTTLDLSGFDTSSVTTWNYFLSGCDALRYVTLGSAFFATTLTLPFGDVKNLGVAEDGTDNGWLAHLAETAPTITDGTARTIALPTLLKSKSWATEQITILQAKGYTVA